MRMPKNIESSKSFYNTNADFKTYVDKCAVTYRKSVDEILQSPITEEYKKSLMDGGCNAKNKGKEV